MLARVDIEALAGFLAECSRLVYVLQDCRDTHAVAIRGFKNLGNVMPDVDAHFVGKFQPTHGHTESLNNIVKPLRVDSLLEKIRRFVHIGQQDTVNDEALFVFDNDSHFAKLSCESDRSGERFFTGFFCDNNFQQRHAMDRIEKMKTTDFVRAVCTFRHFRHRERRRIGQ